MKDTTNHVSTGELNKIIGVTFPSTFVMGFGVQPAIITKTGYFWNRSDIPLICINLSQYFLKQAIAIKRCEISNPPKDNTHTVNDIWSKLSVRASNILVHMEIDLDMPLEDFCKKYTQHSFLRRENFGKVCLKQLLDALQSFGYKLKPH